MKPTTVMAVSKGFAAAPRYDARHDPARFQCEHVEQLVEIGQHLEVPWMDGAESVARH